MTMMANYCLNRFNCHEEISRDISLLFMSSVMSSAKD